MLAKTVQAEESISSLILMTRSYININLGLEPNRNEYFTDRKLQIRLISTEMIERTRLNMKDLQ